MKMKELIFDVLVMNVVVAGYALALVLGFPQQAALEVWPRFVIPVLRGIVGVVAILVGAAILVWWTKKMIQQACNKQERFSMAIGAFMGVVLMAVVIGRMSAIVWVVTAPLLGMLCGAVIFLPKQSSDDSPLFIGWGVPIGMAAYIAMGHGLLCAGIAEVALAACYAIPMIAYGFFEILRSYKEGDRKY